MLSREPFAHRFRLTVTSKIDEHMFAVKEGCVGCKVGHPIRNAPAALEGETFQPVIHDGTTLGAAPVEDHHPGMNRNPGGPTG